MNIAARADGSILWAIADHLGSPPNELQSAAAARITLDEHTNAAIVASISADPGRYRLNAGQLTRDGQAVAISPAGQAEQDRQSLPATLAALEAKATPTPIERAIRVWLRERLQP